MLGLECSSICSRDMDVDSDWQKKIRSLWNVDMEKIRLSIKLLIRKFSASNWRQANTELFGKGNVEGLAMFWDKVDFGMKLLKAEWEVNQQEGGGEFKCYMICRWRWLCCIQTCSRGWRRMDTQRNDDTDGILSMTIWTYIVQKKLWNFWLL